MSAIGGPSSGGPRVQGAQNQKTSSGLAGLKTGDNLKALVVETLSDTDALLEIGGRAIIAKSKSPFSFAGMKGKGVLLTVLGRTSSGEPLLKFEGELSPEQKNLSGLTEGEVMELSDLLSTGPEQGGKALEDALLALIKSGDAGEKGKNLYDLLSMVFPKTSEAPAQTQAAPAGFQFFPSVEELSGPVLEKAFAESGILLEANLLDLVKGGEIKTKKSSLENDLKALVLKFLEAAPAGKGATRDASLISGRLLRDIRAFQLLSRLTGSLYSFLPVRWPGLREGLAGFKSGEAGACCLINLDLEETGRINISVFMRGGSCYVTLHVENADFRETLRQETGLLEGMLSKAGLLTRSVTITGYEGTGYEGPSGKNQNHPEYYLEFRGDSGKNLINITL